MLLIVLQNSGKSIKACVSYSDFKKCCEKKKEKKKNTKKTIQTLKAHISGMTKQIQLKFKIRVLHFKENSTEKFVAYGIFK